jgi:tRNA G18 (ribose-2'-O)-methylase SpoU
MPVIRLDDPQDARLDWYRNVRDRVLRRADDRFILEGRTILERFLDAGYADRVESVLVETDRGPDAGHPAMRGLFARLPDRAPIYVIDPQPMAAVTGMKTHTGVLAIARRPEPLALDDLMTPIAPDAARAVDSVGGADQAAGDHSGGGGETSGGRPLYVVAHAIKETVNLGALMRVAAAFGVRGLILGPHCCDPFYRRAVRVSMGAAFRLPVFRSDDLTRDLTRLRDAFGVRLAALELTDDAEPLPHANLPHAPHAARPPARPRGRRPAR